jgi:hypothetical protein
VTLPFAFGDPAGTGRRYHVDAVSISADGVIECFRESVACNATLRVRPSIPPYLLPGDRMSVSLLVENNGSERQVASLALRAADGSVVDVESPGPGTIPDEGTARFAVGITARRAGTGVVVGQLTGSRALVPVAFDIPVLAASRVHESTLSVIAVGGK